MKKFSSMKATKALPLATSTSVLATWRTATLLLLLFTAIISRFNVAETFECYTCNSNNGEDDTKPCVDKVEKCPEGVESCSMVVYLNRRDNARQRPHVRKFCTSPGTSIYQHLLFFPGSSLCQNIDTSHQGSMPPSPPPSPPLRAVLTPSDEPPSPNTATVVDHRWPFVVVLNRSSSSDSPLPHAAAADGAATKRTLVDDTPLGSSPPQLEPPSAATTTTLRRRRARREQQSPGGIGTMPETAAAVAMPPAPPQENVSSLLCVCSRSRCNGGTLEEVLASSMLLPTPTTAAATRNSVGTGDEAAPAVPPAIGEERAGDARLQTKKRQHAKSIATAADGLFLS